MARPKDGWLCGIEHAVGCEARPSATARGSNSTIDGAITGRCWTLAVPLQQPPLPPPPSLPLSLLVPLMVVEGPHAACLRRTEGESRPEAPCMARWWFPPRPSGWDVFQNGGWHDLAEIGAGRRLGGWVASPARRPGARPSPVPPSDGLALEDRHTQAEALAGWVGSIATGRL